MLNFLTAPWRPKPDLRWFRRQLQVLPLVRVIDTEIDEPRVRISGEDLIDLGSYEYDHAIHASIELCEHFTPIFAVVFEAGFWFWRRPKVRFWAHEDDAIANNPPSVITTTYGKKELVR